MSLGKCPELEEVGVTPTPTRAWHLSLFVLISAPSVHAKACSYGCSLSAGMATAAEVWSRESVTLSGFTPVTVVIWALWFRSGEDGGSEADAELHVTS